MYLQKKKKSVLGVGDSANACKQNKNQNENCKKILVNSRCSKSEKCLKKRARCISHSRSQVTHPMGNPQKLMHPLWSTLLPFLVFPFYISSEAHFSMSTLCNRQRSMLFAQIFYQACQKELHSKAYVYKNTHSVNDRLTKALQKHKACLIAKKKSNLKSHVITTKYVSSFPSKFNI